MQYCSIYCSFGSCIACVKRAYIAYSTRFAQIIITYSIIVRSYIGVKEAAKILKKERTTIVRWIKNGKFEDARKVGSEYEIPLRSFKKWYEENNKELLNLRKKNGTK